MKPILRLAILSCCVSTGGLDAATETNAVWKAGAAAVKITLVPVGLPSTIGRVVNRSCWADAFTSSKRSIRQGTERFLASSADPEATIKKNAQVLVVGSLGGRTVEVAPTDTVRLPR